MVPRENRNNAYAKFWEANKEYYGVFESGQLKTLLIVLHENQWEDTLFRSSSLPQSGEELWGRDLARLRNPGLNRIKLKPMTVLFAQHCAMNWAIKSAKSSSFVFCLTRKILNYAHRISDLCSSFILDLVRCACDTTRITFLLACTSWILDEFFLNKVFIKLLI